MTKEKWNPKVIADFQEVSEVRFARTLAELGELVYKEFRSRQLQDKIESPVATRFDESPRLNERKVANE